MKKAAFGIIALALLFFAARDGLRFYRAYTAQDATPSPTPVPTPSPSFFALRMPEPVENENISVSAPQKNANISLPFTVAGMARVFEATVGISLKDASDKELYRDIATATAPDPGIAGPFTRTITYLFERPATQEALLEVFWNSPKDGEVLDLVRVPITLNVAHARDIKIFLSAPPKGGAQDCDSVLAVGRVIPQGVAPATASMELLMRGTSPKEFDAGYTTAIPSFISMPSIVITQGTATIDFADDALEVSGDPCRTKMMRAQIERTFYQFPNVSGVTITVAGSALGG